VLNSVATKDEITASHINVSFISWAIAQAFMIFSSLEDKALEWAYSPTVLYKIRVIGQSLKAYLPPFLPYTVLDLNFLTY